MASTCDGRPILQSQVEYQNKPVALSLTKSHLSWDATARGHDHFVDLREVIGVKLLKVPPKPALSLKRSNHVKKGQSVCFEMQPLDPIGFVVYVVQRSSNHKWRHKQYSFQCKECHHWINKIKEVLKTPGFNRPQRLIVFVNPCSGKRKAVKTYREKVQPLFELAEIDVTVVETKYANHAREEIQNNLDLSKYDGLVCVGGDGMFSELLNGLLNRTLKDEGVDQDLDHTPVQPELRIGIIPAGSTDTIVYTTTGINDPMTSALHIIVGDSMGIDVNSVAANGQFDRYSVTMMAYGYMGDLLKDSETNRWMGPVRYEWSGTKAFLANKSYEGEVTFEVCPESEGLSEDNKSTCYSGCTTCSLSRNRVDLSVSDNFQDAEDGDSIVMDKSISGSEQVVRGRFAAINGVTMSCRCDIAPTGMSPTCHLGDGCLDLILISDCSRFKFLRWLLSVAKGEQSNNSYVQRHRVRRFSFRLLHNDSVEDVETEVKSNRKHQKLKSQQHQHSVWNCDGEVIRHPKVDVRVHCQLIKIFARGIEELDIERRACTHCCSSPETL